VAVADPTFGHPLSPQPAPAPDVATGQVPDLGHRSRVQHRADVGPHLAKVVLPVAEDGVGFPDPGDLSRSLGAGMEGAEHSGQPVEIWARLAAPATRVANRRSGGSRRMTTRWSQATPALSTSATPR